MDRGKRVLVERLTGLDRSNQTPRRVMRVAERDTSLHEGLGHVGSPRRSTTRGFEHSLGVEVE
jgi:hypothetical protein